MKQENTNPVIQKEIEMRTNRNPAPVRTHEGAVAKRINAEQELRRSVMSCMLWEKTFYEDGESIADRIASLVPKVQGTKVRTLAVKARQEMKLRHAPLWLAVAMAKCGSLRAEILAMIIQRADELTEFLSLYWLNGKCPLSGQVKKGLALAFRKFDAYSLAKYNRPSAIKLRDVLFLCHAKPKDAEQAATWKQLIDGTLASPDTWEVGLSGGGDKKETFTRLLKEKKLGGMALLRNLRNMADVKVDSSLVCESLAEMNTDRILPFRFIAAARHAPQWESAIEDALFRSLAAAPKLSGTTVLLVDVSGSMTSPLSDKSDMTRMDAACGVAICAREMCEDVRIYGFSTDCKRIPSRRGFALRDAISSSCDWASTYLGKAVKKVNADGSYDRIIVITDEQSYDIIPNPTDKGYVINVASYQNGIGYGAWTHIDGFSEAVLKYIVASEAL